MEHVLTHDAPESVLSSAITIQIVDDHALIRDALASLFSASANLRVVAISGTIDEAIRAAGALNPDIVLLDLVMPERSVFAGARSIAAASPRSKLLLLDEFVHDHHLRQALRIRAAGYVTKSITFQFLEESLRRAFDGQQVFMPEVFSRLTSTNRGWQLVGGLTDKPLANLTDRETEVLTYLAQGYTVKQCAAALSISASTVDNHKQRMMKKLNVHKTVDLTRLAIRAGLVPG
jgi:DNA-binding NarL/FixJ family response regulator